MSDTVKKIIEIVLIVLVLAAQVFFGIKLNDINLDILDTNEKIEDVNQNFKEFNMKLND